MRILVLGATGYVGSRLVPELLARGHAVTAASSSPPDPDRFSWGGRVRWARTDARAPREVRTAARGADAVAYLVHSLADRDFVERDRRSATAATTALRRSGTGRVVYLSGLVPPLPRSGLSPHLASRLEVEEILADAAPSVLSLRAGVVIGAGSTSFEIIRQSAAVTLVQPLPSWMTSLVQPISVRDVVRRLADALERPGAVGHVDVGGPDVLSYSALLGLYCRLAGLHRLRLAAPGASPSMAALLAPLLCAAPWWTVSSLVRSLEHDMVCRPADDTPGALEALIAGAPAPLPIAHAIERSLRPATTCGEATSPGGDPHVLAGSDPSWVQAPRWRRLVPHLPLGADTVLVGAGHIAERRLRALAAGPG